MCLQRRGAAAAPLRDSATEVAVRALMRPFLGSMWRTRELPGDLTLGPRGLTLDSMTLLEILLACEAHFGVTLAVEDLRSDNGGEPTLSGLIELVASRQSHSAGT